MRQAAAVQPFVLFNFAGLIADIFLAHSENHFRRETEYVPLLFPNLVVLGWIALWVMRRHVQQHERDLVLR
jgi:hypothetical protein